MATGTVKFFNEAKGYGFIKEDGTDREVFVHATGVLEKIRDNDHVSFEIAEGKRGPNAINVKKV